MTHIYQFKITLADSTPPIWRRVLIPNRFTLKDLHTVIQACFDWEDCHLYTFDYLGEQYDDEHPKWLSKKLSSFNLKEKSQLKYTYDFGDDWNHRVLLEKMIMAEKGKIYPCCMAGKRTAPPEDSGDVWGYEEKLSILVDETHPEHEDIVEWMGEGFDPDAFNINEVNERLKRFGSNAA